MRPFLQSLALATSAVALSGCGMFQPTQTREARVSLRVADAAMEAGAPDVALRVADIVLKRQPNDAAAMLARAQALYAMGVADQARAAYRQAVAVDPGNPDALIGLGRTLIRADPRGAEAAFLAALKIDPDNVLALNDLGIARDMLGQHDDAQKAYRQALTVSPDSADVRTNLRLSLALSGDPQTTRPFASAPSGPRLNQAVAEAAPPGASPLAINPAPVAAVRREPLPAKPAVPVALAETVPAPVTAPPALTPAAAPQARLTPAVEADATPVAVVAQAAPLPILAQATPISVPAQAAPIPVVAQAAPIPVVAQATPIPVPAQATSALVDAKSAPVVVVSKATPEPVMPKAASAPVMPKAASAPVVAKVAPSRVVAKAAPSLIVVPQSAPLAKIASGPIDLASVKADASAVIPASAIPVLVERPVALQPITKPDAATVAPAEPAVDAQSVPAPTSKSPGGYYVQMAALDSARGALLEWTKLRARWPDLFVGRTPTVQQADVNQRSFWRLRTGLFADAGSANEFCVRLHAAGSGCWTVPQGRE